MSDNLELSQVATAQNNKEVTINDQAGQLDAGLTDKVDVSLTGTTSPLVLSDAQALRCMVLKLTGTHPGGAYEVHCPTNRKIYVVWNGTAGDVTFRTVAGTGILVNAGAVLILYCDGTDVIQLAGLVATIDDIGDVVITAAASGQMLRFGWGFSTNQDFNGDIALIACFAASWTPAMIRRWNADPFGFLRPWNEVPALMGSAPPATPPSTATGVVTFLMG